MALGLLCLHSQRVINSRVACCDMPFFLDEDTYTLASTVCTHERAFLCWVWLERRPNEVGNPLPENVIDIIVELVGWDGSDSYFHHWHVSYPYCVAFSVYNCRTDTYEEWYGDYSWPIGRWALLMLNVALQNNRRWALRQLQH